MSVYACEECVYMFKYIHTYDACLNIYVHTCDACLVLQGMLVYMLEYAARVVCVYVCQVCVCVRSMRHASYVCMCVKYVCVCV